MNNKDARGLNKYMNDYDREDAFVTLHEAYEIAENDTNLTDEQREIIMRHMNSYIREEAKETFVDNDEHYKRDRLEKYGFEY